jgi:hypothetical protein
MYQDILQRIEGIGIFPVISLVLFVSLFSVVLVVVVRMDRSRAERLASLPMDDDAPRALSNR